MLNFIWVEVQYFFMGQKKKNETQKMLGESDQENQKTLSEQTEQTKIEDTQIEEKVPEQTLEELSAEESVPIEKTVPEPSKVTIGETPKNKETEKKKEESEENVIPIEMAPDCESCGMPMQRATDHGNEDLNNPYCVSCTDDEGKLKSFDVVKTQMIEFYTQIKNCSWLEAENVVAEMMKHLPAWNKNEKPKEESVSTQ